MAKPLWTSARAPSSRRLLVIVLVVAISLVAFLGIVYTQPVSKVQIRAYVGQDYGSVQVSVYLDNELKGSKNVSWTAGAFDEVFEVVPGKHVVHADWSKSVDGMTNETTRIQIDPFSTREVNLLHGVGMA